VSSIKNEDMQNGAQSQPLLVFVSAIPKHRTWIF